MITLEKVLARMNRAATLGATGRHKHYDRLVRQADNLTILATGEGFEEFLVMFERRENDQQFIQRKKISVSKSESILRPALSQFFGLSMLKNVKKDIVYADTTDTSNVKRIKDAMKAFYGVGGVDDFMATVFDWASLIDPGSFCVVEFEKDEPNKIQPYGLIYWSKDVYEWGQNRQKQITYLLVELPQVVKNTKGDDMKVTDYLLYNGDFAMRYTQLTDGGEGQRADENGALYRDSATNIYAPDPVFQDPANKQGPLFLRQQYNTNLPFVNAFPLGYIPDPVTQFTTCTSAISPAQNVLIDYIRTSSNKDLSKYLHVMPQKVAMQPPCPGAGIGNPCKDGKLLDGSKCTRCGGTGRLAVHTQPDDTIYITMPDNPEDMPDLSKLIHYVRADIESFNALKEDLRDLETRAMVAIFNSEVVQQQQVGIDQTATETVVRREDKNKTLYPAAQHRAAVWKFIVQCIAEYVCDAGYKTEKLTVTYDNPKNLAPVSMTELYTEMKAAIDSEAPSFVVEQIAMDMAEVVFEGDQDALSKLHKKMRHVPFIGLTWNQITALDAKGYIRKKDMVLIAYQDSVFSDMEMQEKGFYEMSYTERQTLIDKYIDAIMGELPQDAMPKLPPAKIPAV